MLDRLGQVRGDAQALAARHILRTIRRREHDDLRLAQRRALPHPLDKSEAIDNPASSCP
ncbi:MAG: hypothetical protein WDN28_24140 [Chthoniobacter sp.]